VRDAQAFDEFYRNTSIRMLRFGYAVIADRAEAQDIVQEAYARAWRRWDTVHAHPSPESWIRLVVTRLATDRWRRQRGWLTVAARTGPPEPAGPPSENAVLLREALRRLPVRQRQALALYYLADLTVEQIAHETGAAPNTVKSWLSRGRARLAEILSDLDPYRSAEAHDA
jgi:RNA polymerase sigma-70 factor (ECF subfamily)